MRVVCELDIFVDRTCSRNQSTAMAIMDEVVEAVLRKTETIYQRYQQIRVLPWPRLVKVYRFQSFIEVNSALGT